MDIEAVVDEQVNPEDLKKFRELYEKQISRGKPDSKAAFEYAHCLIRSIRPHVKMGIELLEELLRREDQGSEKREYFYYLSTAYLRIKEYDKALNAVNALLRVEPTNQQCLDLKALILKRKQNDAIKGAAILGGVTLVGGVALLGAVAALTRITKK